jgi:hypothetical protein
MLKKINLGIVTYEKQFNEYIEIRNLIPESPQSRIEMRSFNLSIHLDFHSGNFFRSYLNVLIMRGINRFLIFLGMFQSFNSNRPFKFFNFANVDVSIKVKSSLYIFQLIISNS